jgi:hypothetical protein
VGGNAGEGSTGRRRHWYSPVSRRWEYIEKFPSTDEEAERLLSGTPEAEPYLEVYREWRFEVGASVEHALLRASELARQEADNGHGEEEETGG